MTTKRSVLLVIDGICKTPYVLEDLYNQKDLIGKVTDYYRIIERIETNQIRDKWLIGGNLILKYGDVLRFLYSPLRRPRITRLIEDTVKRYKALGFEVTILAHSLGTIELIDSKIFVDKVILAGCPLGFCSRIGTFAVKNAISPFPWSKPKLKCDKLVYLWAPQDIVSNREPHDLDRFIKFNTSYILNIGKPHDFTNYLEYLQVKDLLPLTID